MGYNASSRIEFITIFNVSHRIQLIGRQALDSPVLIFLHEGLGCIEFWRDFPEAICEKANCAGMVYDRRGYGLSDPLEEPWPFDYLDDEVRFLKGILDVYEIRETILIGHSDGGTIALLAASGGDPRIKGLITEAAHIFVEDITVEGIKAFVEVYRRDRLKQKFEKYHGGHAETVFFRWADRWLSDEFRSWNIERRLPGIACPLLALQGDSDEYGTKKQILGIINGVSGPARYDMVPNCGHIPHHQNRAYVSESMTGFIREIMSDPDKKRARPAPSPFL